MPREQTVLFATTLEDRIPQDYPSVLCKVLLFSMIRSVPSSRQMEYQLTSLARLHLAGVGA